MCRPFVFTKLAIIRLNGAPCSHPVQSSPMFAAHPFALNTASAAQAGVAARAITTKTTTIKG